MCCQYWCTAMFSPTVVGTANAFAGGWGNLGGGFTQLVRIASNCTVALMKPQPAPAPSGLADFRDLILRLLPAMHGCKFSIG